MTFKRFIGLLILTGIAATAAWAKFEEQQLALETQLQQRIESILAKTLPPNSYIVTVKVEMDNKAQSNSVRSTTGKKGGGNPFLAQNQFVLPGVPEKKEFVQNPETSTNETVVNAFSAEAMVRRIQITILLAPDINAEQIRQIRDILSASIPFNPLRGDEIDIQNSPLLKRTVAAAAPAAAAAASAANPKPGFFAGAMDRANIPFITLLAAIVIAFAILLAFLFGPVRAFLNRLLAVLPRIGEQAAYTVSNAPVKAPSAAGPLGVGGPIGSFNGNGHGPQSDMPFNFIREDQLNKLPILFRQLSSAQSALVLAYLPPEWASRVLAGMDAASQSATMRELSQAREVPAEVVKEVEAQIKAKLPYLVGGVDWVQSVYQLTQPQTQRTLLGTLNQQSPELARALRRKTFFFEDIDALTPGALRLVVQELGYPTIAMCLKDEKPEFRNAVMGKLPPGMREIIQQELELSADDKVGIADAKVRLVTLARRLMVEGRITLPERK